MCQGCGKDKGLTKTEIKCLLGAIFPGFAAEIASIAEIINKAAQVGAWKALGGVPLLVKVHTLHV